MQLKELSRSAYMAVINDLRMMPDIRIDDAIILQRNEQDNWPEPSQYHQVSQIIYYKDIPLSLSFDNAFIGGVTLHFPSVHLKKMTTRQQYETIPGGGYYYKYAVRTKTNYATHKAYSHANTAHLYEDVVEQYKKYQVNLEKSKMTDTEWLAAVEKKQKTLDVKNTKLLEEALDRFQPNRPKEKKAVKAVEAALAK